MLRYVHVKGKELLFNKLIINQNEMSWGWYQDAQGCHVPVPHGVPQYQPPSFHHLQ